ncbi:phosphatidylinositol 4-kinase gamma 8 [Senna tora]|uniref:1-phosphatidylinositol 4-kinase n=1 Tax=Senna tora TaxID=362788 RepID=A0A834TDH4_9FABA|nr:phosphatidylinositol 4-kinase gamma 8 [Senna tora]
MRLFKMALAVNQHHGLKPFGKSHRCILQSYGDLDHNNLDHSQTSLAHSFKPVFEGDNSQCSFSTPCLPLTTSGEEELDSNPWISMVGERAASAHALVVEVAMAMASGVRPQPLSKGLGGAYVFRSQNGNDIAVAKPADEEPLAFNNPKGLGGRMLGQPGLKDSIRLGETGIRELAAYLLDHGGFAGVPPSALVKFCNAPFSVTDGAKVPSAPCKIASLQRFIDHDFDAGELGPSFFSVASVHQIGILDIRLLNLDRHAGNLLVKKNDHKGAGVSDLVPIDHGLCLPEWLDDPYFEWLHWPQASIPFSETELEYISKLDPFKDAELLRAILPLLRESSIRVHLVCTIFLKQAAAAGLCLADIGQMMTRKFCGGEEAPSELENICLQVMASVSNNEKSREETEQESSFDNETRGISQVLKIPVLSFAGSMNGLAVLPPLNEENDDINTDADAGNTKENNERCDSYTNGEIGFGGLNLSEWELFLENFEKLLSRQFGAKSISICKYTCSNPVSQGWIAIGEAEAPMSSLPFCHFLPICSIGHPTFPPLTLSLGEDPNFGVASGPHAPNLVSKVKDKLRVGGTNSSIFSRALGHIFRLLESREASGSGSRSSFSTSAAVSGGGGSSSEVGRDGVRVWSPVVVLVALWSAIWWEWKRWRIVTPGWPAI